MTTNTLHDSKYETRTLGGKTIPVAVVSHIRSQGRVAKFGSSAMSLLKGMRLTLSYLLRPSTIVTQSYPENRATLRFPERYRANLRFKYDADGHPDRRKKFLQELAWDLDCNVNHVATMVPEDDDPRYHRCTGCKNCEKACPNGSIKVITRVGAITEDRELDRFVWRMDSCMFCNACVQACPWDAIEMTHAFENAVYDRRLLVFNLNRLAGPAARVLREQADEDPSLCSKMMDRRDAYGGPVPVNGHRIPNVRPLSVPPRVDPPPLAGYPASEAGQ